MKKLLGILGLVTAISVLYWQVSGGANSTSSIEKQDAATTSPPTPQIISQCASCHGQTGVSTTRYVPHLSGQRRAYLSAQIRAFQDNTRPNPGMHAVVMPLAGGLVEDVAAYFWAQGQTEEDRAFGFDSSIILGPKLVELVEKCDRCHEANDYSQETIRQYPILAGQRAEYLAHEMRNFQNKHRRDNDLMYAMTDVLIGEDIDKIAYYYQNKPSPQRVGR